MKKYRLKIFNIHVLVLICIFISEDTLLFGTNVNNVFIISKYIIYVLLLIFTILTSKFRNIYRFEVSKVILVLLIVLLSTLINNDFRAGISALILVFICSLIFINKIDFKSFMAQFTSVILFLCKFSIIVYLVNIISPNLLSYFPIINNYADVSFRFVLFSNVFESGNEFRNTGIFREPGVYAIYILFAILNELFVNKESSTNRRTLILIVTLITTMSTSAFIILPVIFSLYSSINLNRKVLFITLLFSIALLLLFYKFPNALDIVFSKLDSRNYEYASTLSRISGFQTSISIFLDHPIFGSGLSNFVDSYKDYSFKIFGIPFTSDSTATNTIANIFAVFGFFMGVLYLHFLYDLSRLFVKRHVIIMFIIFLLMFSTQELRFSLFFNVMIAYGIFFNDNKVLYNLNSA